MPFNLWGAIKAREKYLANLTPEERRKAIEEEEAELKASDEKFRKLLQKLFEDNKHHEDAIKVLEKRIKEAIDDPVMTPEIKDLAETFLVLIKERKVFKYDYESFFGPVIKQERNEGVLIDRKRISDKKHEKSRAQSKEAIRLWKEEFEGKKGMSKNNAAPSIAEKTGLAESTVREKLKGK